MIQFTSIRVIFLAVLTFLSAFSLGQSKAKISEAEKMIWADSHIISLKRALKSKHPETIKGISMLIDSTEVFPTEELMQFKNLEYLVVIAKGETCGYGILGTKVYPPKEIQLKIDTARLQKFLHLKYLEFQGFDFEVFPKGICTLKHLKCLAMGVCNIDALPEEISKMTSLEAMEFRCNNISSLPKGIEKLDSLIVLDMANNAFNKLPKEILQMKSLADLQLANTESNWESSDSTPGDFPIHMNKINYIQNRLFMNILEMPHFKTFAISVVDKCMYLENVNPDNFTKRKAKYLIMPDKALRKKIDYSFDD